MLLCANCFDATTTSSPSSSGDGTSGQSQTSTQSTQTSSQTVSNTETDSDSNPGFTFKKKEKTWDRQLFWGVTIVVGSFCVAGCIGVALVTCCLKAKDNRKLRRIHPEQNVPMQVVYQPGQPPQISTVGKKQQTGP